jgi:hypothetical protein
VQRRWPPSDGATKTSARAVRAFACRRRAFCIRETTDRVERRAHMVRQGRPIRPIFCLHPSAQQCHLGREELWCGHPHRPSLPFRSAPRTDARGASITLLPSPPSRREKSPRSSSLSPPAPWISASPTRHRGRRSGDDGAPAAAASRPPHAGRRSVRGRRRSTLPVRALLLLMLRFDSPFLLCPAGLVT